MAGKEAWWKPLECEERVRATNHRRNFHHASFPAIKSVSFDRGSQTSKETRFSEVEAICRKPSATAMGPAEADQMPDGEQQDEAKPSTVNLRKRQSSFRARASSQGRGNRPWDLGQTTTKADIHNLNVLILREAGTLATQERRTEHEVSEV